MMNKAQLLNKQNWLAYLERANEEELTRNAIANDIVAKIAEALSASDKLDQEAITATHCYTELVCVDNVNYEYITIGKNYRLEAETETYYKLDNDLGHSVSMSKVRFNKL
jgi:hypothetical protein